MTRLDLWKKDNFQVKDAVLLSCFLLGMRFLVDITLDLTGINLTLLYDLAFLVIVIVIIKQFGRGELSRILRWRKIPSPLFFALTVMYFGLEIIRRELGNIMEIIITPPGGFFDHAYPRGVLMIILSGALFPAFTEELFFRGILLNRLRSSCSKRKALVVSSLLFGLMHLNPWQALIAFVSGLFLGWLYLEFRTLWLCIFIHAYNNILAFFVPFPVNYLPNTKTYAPLVLHPLWFDILGVLLFAAGLALTFSQRVKER